MDTREDLYFYGLDQADRPRPRYTVEETARFNALMAEKDAHRAECPMGQVGKISTLCVCKELEKSEAEEGLPALIPVNARLDTIHIGVSDQADECLRCHQFVDLCRCGAKAQWV